MLISTPADGKIEAFYGEFQKSISVPVSSWVTNFEITKTIRLQNRTHRSSTRGGRGGQGFRPY